MAGLWPFPMQPLIRFTLAAGVSAFVLIILGFTTDLRWFAHGTLIAIGAVAFLPFILIALGIIIPAALMLLSLLAALVSAFMDGGGVDSSLYGGGGDIGLVQTGADMTPGYYRFFFARFIARRRYPIFWGIPAGLLVGAIVLTAYLWIAVIPGESRTAEALLDLYERMEKHYERRNGYPDPVDGKLMLESLGEEAPPDSVGPALDGFGRPLIFEKRGAWKVASYRLKSLGHDGVPSRDDLCRGDSTTLAKVASVVRISRNGKTLGWSERLGAIAKLRCDD